MSLRNYDITNNMKSNNILQEAKQAIEQAQSQSVLEELRVKYLGRKGIVAEFFAQLTKLKGDERARQGQELNALKHEITRALEQRENAMQTLALEKLAEAEALDVTLPGARLPYGHLHITTQAIEEISRIFAQLGFQRMRYPEIDWDYYAFESLNMPKGHPARDEWETFFIAGSQQTLTRPNGHPLPEREGGVRAAEHPKKGRIDYFARAYYGKDRRTRLRPFHFRFTEPSFEIDISCGICGGTGEIHGERCKVCKSGWHELGGAGMVHPNVLKAGGIDPKEYSGFACGWGIERMLMMKLKLSDIRAFYIADLNFLEQF